MSTTTVRTIGSTGDYSTLQAWEDAAPANLTTSISGGEIWEGQCLNETFSGSATMLTLSGSTTDATGYKHLTTAAGASFRDNGSVQTNALRFNAANGAAITANPYNGAVIDCSENFARISKLQIANTDGGAAARGISGSGSNCRIDGVIIEAKGTAGSGGTINMSGSALIFTNSLFVQRSASANLIVQVAGAPTFVNCTLAVPSDKAAASTGLSISYPSSAVVRNCGVFGITNIGPTSGVTYTTCFTDESTSLPSGVTTTAYATGSGAQFENITDGTHDYRIKTGSSLKDTGTTDTTYGTPDIAGTARPSGSAYDVGAWEFVQGGGGGSVFNPMTGRGDAAAQPLA